MAGLVAGLVHLLQTETVANYISERVSREISKKFKSDVKFEKLDLGLFPPSIDIHNLELKSTEFDYKEFEIHVGQFGFKIDFIDLISSKLTISKIQFRDVVLRINNEHLAGIDQKLPIIEYLIKKFDRKEDDNQSKLLDKIKKFAPAEEILTELNNLVKAKIRTLELHNLVVKKGLGSISLSKARVSQGRTNIDLFLEIPELPIHSEFIDKLQISKIALDLRYLNKKIKLLHGLLSSVDYDFALSGDINNLSTDFSKTKINLESKLSADLVKLSMFSGIHSILGVEKGEIEAKSKINFTGKQFDIKSKVVIRDLISKVADAKTLKVALLADNNKIQVIEGELKNENQLLNINKPFELYNFKQDKMVATPIITTINNLDSYNMLKSINSILYPLLGEFSGTIEVSHVDKAFIFKGISNLHLKNFQLNFDSHRNRDKSILSSNELIMETPLFIWDYLNKKFSASTTLKNKNSTVKIDGFVDQEMVNFVSHNVAWDFSDFGNISGIKINGTGKFDIKIDGPLDDVHFNFMGDYKKISFLEYVLGDIRGEIDLGLKDKTLRLNNILGTHMISNYQSNGFINLDNQDINIDIDFPKLNLSDALVSLKPVLKDKKIEENLVSGTFKTKAKISGKLNSKDLIVKGDLTSKKLHLKTEYFNELKLSYKLENGELQINPIRLLKDGGVINGKVVFNFIEDRLVIEGALDQLQLQEIDFIKRSPTKLNGVLWGNFLIQKEKDKWKNNLQLSLKNSTVGVQKVDNSKLILSIEDNILIYEVALLGNWVTGNGNIDFNIENHMKNNSRVSLNYYIDDPSVALSILLGRIVKETDLTGLIKGNIDFNFSPYQLKYFDFMMNIDNFSLNLAGKNYVITSGNNISIKDGNMSSVDLRISGTDSDFSIRGTGNINQEYQILGNFNLNGEILEDLIEGVAASSGHIKTEFRFFQNGSTFTLDGTTRSNDLFINYEKVPSVFNNIDFLVYFSLDKIFIDHFDVTLNSGKFNLSGDLSPPPNSKVSLFYNFDNASFTYLGKTNLILNGKGNINSVNDRLFLNGDIIVSKATIFNEFEDFTGSSTQKKDVDKFLPSGKKESQNQFFNYQVNIDIQSPIYLKNSMVELNLSGNTVLSGNLSNPHLNGRISVVGGNNKLFFKSNDFTVARGSLNFLENDFEINPELDFLASSNIAEYLVNMRIFGRLKNFQVDLGSEPGLAQNDILSLITLGYTNDISQNLGSTDKSALAGAGIGSLLFDRFKINDGLKSSLGLKVNVTSEFREGAAGGSLLKGRGSSSTGTSGASYRSGTKVELRKKVSEAVDLSVSSTVGTNIGQRQSMNLNYNFNKNVAAEGVYEIRTNDEGVEDVVATSIGGDLKLKWTFK